MAEVRLRSVLGTRPTRRMSPGIASSRRRWRRLCSARRLCSPSTTHIAPVALWPGARPRRSPPLRGPRWTHGSRWHLCGGSSADDGARGAEYAKMMTGANDGEGQDW